MTRGLHRLPLEKPIYEIEDRIAELESAPLGAQQQEELRRLKREGVEIQKKIFGNLGPWQTVEVARHPDRPKTSDYLSLVFEEFVELHGDKAFGDDPAMLTGFAKLDRHKVLVVGHQKGKTLAERQACHFGCAHPEGYRKSMGKMRMAAKYGLPVICLIDTPGAYPGIGAEERGQSEAIAMNLMEMFQLKTPIIAVIIGEGGSGGALALAVGDRVMMFEHSVYSVISPEGCAAILWKKNDSQVVGKGEYEKACEALKMTSRDLLDLGIIDEIIPEPLGGAHRSKEEAAEALEAVLLRSIDELGEKSFDELLEERYRRFRIIGKLTEEE